MKLIKYIKAILTFAPAPAEEQPKPRRKSVPTPESIGKAKARRARKSTAPTATCVGYTRKGLENAIAKSLNAYEGKRQTKAANPPSRLKGFATSEGIRVTDILGDNPPAKVIAAFVRLGNASNPRPSGKCPKGYKFRGKNAIRVKVKATK
jgi:hypothetical protein